MYATALFDGDFSVRLTFALLHLLWQGSLIAVLTWAANGCLRRTAARTRYLINLAALVVIAVCLPATYLAGGPRLAERGLDVAAAGDSSAVADNRNDREPRDSSLRELPVASAMGSAESLPSSNDGELAASELLPVEPSRATMAPKTGSLSVWIQSAAPYATVAYFVGVLAMLLRLAVALWGGQRLRSASEPVSDETLFAMIQRVAMRVGLKVAPAVAWCQRVTVPVVVGVVRPLVLLPASLASGLVPEQIESLLTHELAHIRRHDLWVNLLQRLIEAAFFFHPAVWYVSRCVSTERENCCDDFVLSAGWPRVQYADALVRMAELCLAARSARLTPQAVLPRPTLLAASGESQSQFKSRVLRLLGHEPSPAPLLNRAGVLGLILGIAALLAAPLVVRSFAQAAPGETEARADDAPLAAATAPTDAWPQWGGSGRRNHVSLVTGLPVSWDVAKNTNVKWIAPLGSATYSSPIVAGDKVLIGTNNAAGRIARFPKTTDLSCLQCFDKATGRFLWQFSSQKLPSGRANDWPSIGLCASPCVEGDRAWLMTNRCEVVCLDLQGEGASTKPVDEPKVLWRTDLMELGVRPFCQAACSVTLAGDLVLLNTSNGVDESHNKIPAPEAPSFVALSRDTGRVIWSDASPGGNLLPACPSASPAVADLGGVWQAIFCGGDGWVYSFDARDIARGKTTLLWKFDANPKTTRWEQGGKGNRNTLIASPTVYQNRVYIVTGRCPEDGEGPGHLWCIDPTKRGDLSNEVVFNRADPTKPIAPKRWQACDAAAGDFTRANANSGVIWHYESSDLNGNGRHDFVETLHRAVGSVTVAAGFALVADTAGILHCLDARTGEPNWTHDLASAVWSTPLVADGRVYVADEDGDVAVFRLSRKKGLLGEFNVEGPVYGSMAAADGTLFLATATKLMAVAKPPAVSGDWPSFRGGTQARGTSLVELPVKPTLLWKQVCTADGKIADSKTAEGTAASADRDSFESTAAIVGGTVFVGSREGTLHALDLATGGKKWRYKDLGSMSTPAVQGGWVYVGDSLGTLHCLNAENGNQKWTFAATATIAAGPNFYKDRVIFGSQDASLYCVDAASGKLIWKHTTSDQIRCFPAIEGNRIFVAGCDSKLHVIDADSGKRVEEIGLGGATGCTPAVVGNRLFVGTEEGKFFGIDWREGKVAWTYEQPGRAAGGYRSSPAATDDVVVVGSRARSVIGLSPATGKQLWTFNTGSAIDGSPVISGGRAYFGSSRGRLHAVDIKTGRQVWEYAAGGGFLASPAVAAGKLVIASDDGVIYCFGAKAPADAKARADGKTAPDEKRSTPATSGESETPPAAASATRPATESEKAIAKFILHFLSVESNRALPVVLVDGGHEALVVTAGPATIVPDGVPHAVSRTFVSLAGKPADAHYDSASTAEIFVYRVPHGRSSFQLKEGVALSVGDSLAIASLDEKNRIVIETKAAKVIALDGKAELNLAAHRVHHQFQKLIEIDRLLPEGTPLFKDGKLAGLTLLGTRFLGSEAKKSYVVPVDRIAKLLATMVKKPAAGAPDAPPPKADAAAAQPKVAERDAEPSVETRLAQRVSLKITDQPLIFVLDELERKYHVPVTIDLRALRGKGISPQTRISLDQKEISVREAFRQVLSPVGLEFEVTATGLRVPPAPKPEAPAPKVDAPAPAPKAGKTATDSARISVKYDIPGAEAEAKIYVQHINGRGDIGRESYGPMKYSALKNGSTLELKDLPAGDYQVARYRQVEIGRVGMSRVHSGLYLDRRQFSLKRGEAIAIDFTRLKGRSVGGRVLGLKEAKLEQATVVICSDDAKDDGSLDNLKVTIFDARLCDKDGAFRTERLAPGKYAVLAQGYEPLTEESLKFSGIVRPRYLGVAKFTVSETGELPIVEVSLRDADAKAKPGKTDETAAEKIAAKPDRAASIAFNVLDRTGKKGIASFQVIPGHRPKDGDPEKPVWDRAAARAGKDGGLLWPLADLDDRGWAFLIEADGRDSQFWTWIKRSKGPQFLVFLLAETAKAGQPDKPKEDAKADDVKRDEATKKSDAWGDLTLRFVYDGPQPKLDRLPVSRDNSAFGRDVPDESLVVDKDGGLANVIVFLTSKDAPVHTDERKKGERAAELKVVEGLFQPRVLLVQAGQKVTLINPTPVAVNYHVQTFVNDAVNYVVPGKSDRQIEIRRAERFPLPVQDNIHPWIRSYLFPLDHPYAAVSGGDGVARIRNLPAGEWTFRLWHEKVGYLKNLDGKRDFVFRIDPKGSGAEYRVSPEFALKPAERRAEKPPASDPPAPKTDKPKTGAPQGAEAEAREKATEKKQDEETQRALREFKKRYALADGEDLKFIPAPTPVTRLVYMREELPFVHRSVVQWLPDRLVDCALYLKWDGGLKWHAATVGSTGRTVRGVADPVLGFKLQAVEGDADWLDKQVAGDFVCREGVPAEKLVRPLEAILREQLKLPVKVSIRNVERDVFVVRGEYRFKPLADRPKDQIEIYGRELEDPSTGGGGTGTFDEFLESAGAWMGAPVVSDLKTPPKRVSWHYNLRSPFTDEEHRAAKDPETVLKNLSEQTGLKFEKAKRPLRVLFVVR